MVFGDRVIPSRTEKGQDTHNVLHNLRTVPSWLGCGGGAQFLRVPARGLSQSFLERRATQGMDGPAQSVDDVIGDVRCVGLA